MNKNRKPDVAELVNTARLEIVANTLIGFVESLDGKVPSDEEVIREGLHIQFAKTPLTTFTKDNVNWSQYFIWRRKHALAIQFLNPADPIELSVCRVPNDAWPAALIAFVEQYYARKDAP